MRMKTLKQQQVDVDFEATIIQQHDNEDVEATQVVNFESTMIHQQNLNLNTWTIWIKTCKITIKDNTNVMMQAWEFFGTVTRMMNCKNKIKQQCNDKNCASKMKTTNDN